MCITYQIQLHDNVTSLAAKNVQLLLLNCGYFKSIGYLAVSMINSWTELIDCVTSIIKFLWGARLQRSRATGHITKSWVKCSLFEKVLSEIFTAHWISFSLETTNVNIWSIFIHEKQKSRSVKYSWKWNRREKWEKFVDEIRSRMNAN